MTGLIISAATAVVATAWWYIWSRGRERVWMAAARQAAAPENRLTAFVGGDSIPAMREAALERARALYGPDAQLYIEEVRDIMTSDKPSAFMARVVVRNLGDAA